MLRRIIRISLAVLLVVVLCGAILCASLTNGFRDFNPYCLEALGGHNYDENGVCTRCGAEKLNGIGGDDKPGEEKSPDEEYFLPTPDHLVELAYIAPENYPAYNISSAAETAYELTATIHPSDADNQRVSWSVEFASSEDEWIQDKRPEDFVQVTPASEGSNRATVVCLQSFAAQINVIATSEDKPEISATCLCDYVKRIVGVDLEISTETLMFGSVYTVNATPRYGVGTIEGEYAVNGYKLSLVPEISSALNGLKEQVTEQLDAVNIYYTAKYRTNASVKLKTEIEAQTFSFDGTDAFDIFGNYTVTTSSEDDTSYSISPLAVQPNGQLQATAALRTKVNDTFKAKINEIVGTHMVFTFDFTYVYNNKSYVETTATANLSFDTESLAIHVLSITLNQDHVVF